MRWSWRKALGLPYEAPVATDSAPVSAEMSISAYAVAEAKASGHRPSPPWAIAEPAPGSLPRAGMAMDWQSGPANLYNWALQGAFTEGLAFLGYPYLSELAQRPEYRQIVKKYADHMTRKWIKLQGGSDEERAELDKALKKFRVREVFREVLEHDGFFGRGQIFIDLGNRNPNEIKTPLTLTPNKLQGKLKNLKNVEPIWAYPGWYESTDPLHPDFYKPQQWYVSGKTVHASRMVTVIGREMPDMLKPAYAFGGLSRTQMAKPYVENWLRTRQSVSDLIHSFTVWVLKTDLASLLKGVQGAMGTVLDRIGIFNALRDNHGTFVLNNDVGNPEEFQNVSASLSSLDKLQAQAQEQMASVSAIPLIELLGISPSGLNATSDGEIRTFYANIKTDQERMVREPLTYIMNIIQMSEFGAINPDITFEFEDLWEMSAIEGSTIEKNRIDGDVALVAANIIAPEEARERMSNDEESPYHGVDLSGEPPRADDDNDNEETDDAD